MDGLAEKYESRKEEIKRSIEGYRKVFEESDDRVFAELAFCLCTPQSKATASWSAISSLMRNNLLYTGTTEQIRPFLNTVRFNDTKSKRIVEARSLFSDGEKISIKRRLSELGDPSAMRDWLVENVNGLGMKEASHFLRNIGLGGSFAIIDSHIIKNLHRYGVVDEPKYPSTRKKYLEVEGKMRDFAGKIGIPFDELDLLFWSEETGMVFK